MLFPINSWSSCVERLTLKSILELRFSAEGHTFRSDCPYGECINAMLFFAVKKEGQGGIISCIAFSPDSSGMYALGSYSKSGTMILQKHEITGWNDV